MDARIAVPGGAVETRWWGPPADAAPTIVLLHEGLGCVALWRDFPERLAAATGLGVFAWSRLGYGQSDPVPLPRPLDYMQREAVLLGDVLSAAGIRRCILLGHSDGASIALIRAGSVQDARIRGLVLLAPHVLVEPMCVAAIAAARDRYAHGDLRARLARHHRDPDVAFRGWCDAWLDPAFPTVLDLQPEIAHLRVPVLVVQGEADPYGTLEQLRVIERETYCPVDQLVLPGVGHAPQADAPEAVLAAVGEFTRSLFRVHEPAV